MERRKEVRLESIAKEVGVSIVTVSNALKGKKGVSDEMRKKICDTASAMGYQITKDQSKKKKSYLIGIAVAERYVKEFPSFYMDIYKRVAQELTKRENMSVLEVVNTEQEKMTHGFSAFQGTEINGIVVIGEMSRDYISELSKVYAQAPLVCLDCYDVLEDIDYIVTDSYNGMAQMTELLLDAGHKKLMFVGTPKATGNIMDRYLGFCKALEERGLPVTEDQILKDRELDGYDYKLDVELPEVLPDAFVCNCDKTASILIGKLRAKGIQIPAEVSLVGFDHYYSQVQKEIELTTYENDEKAIAHICVNTLMKRLEGRKKASGVRIVEGKIVYGNTVGRGSQYQMRERAK